VVWRLLFPRPMAQTHDASLAAPRDLDRVLHETRDTASTAEIVVTTWQEHHIGGLDTAMPPRLLEHTTVAGGPATPADDAVPTLASGVGI
jgi:hypothetical protein